MNQIFVFLNFIFLSIVLVGCRDYSTISSSRATNWGDWHAPVFCPGNSFAVGIEIKFEQMQFASDDTHLNAIRLTCDDTASTKIQSGEGPFGRWYDEVEHKSGSISSRTIEITNNTNSARRFESIIKAVSKITLKHIMKAIEKSSKLYLFLSKTENTGCNNMGKFIGFFFTYEPAISGDDTAGNMIRMICEGNVNGLGETISFDMKLSSDPNIRRIDLRYCPKGEAICGIRTQIEPSIDGDDTALNNVDFYCCKNYYKLYNIQTTRSLDSDFNGKVYTLETNNSPHQRWEAIRTDNYFYLKNQATGLVLDSNSAGNVYALAFNGGEFQKWFIDEKNRIVNKATNRALDSDNDGKVYTLLPNDGKYQKWIVQ